MAATPVFIMSRTQRAISSAPPQPVSTSTNNGSKVAWVIRLASSSTSERVVIPRSGTPREEAATPPPDK